MLRFSDIYRSTTKTVYSFEVFPPKTEAGKLALFSELEKIRSFDPAYISVTYGAMGSTRDLTEDLAIALQNKLKLRAAFHFTCVASTPDQVKQYVDHLVRNGIELVVALRGDYPQSQPEDQKIFSSFSQAYQLVRYLKSITPLSIAVAGYPEKHKEAASLTADIEFLKQKVDAGAEAVITQLFFNNQDYFEFINKAQALNIKVPIVAGIMPIQSLSQIQKITQMCGAKIPSALQKALEQNANDPQSQYQIGLDHAQKQCAELKAAGVLGIHFYSLNKMTGLVEILKSLN